jgi:hypothetical protein
VVRSHIKFVVTPEKPDVGERTQIAVIVSSTENGNDWIGDAWVKLSSSDGIQFQANPQLTDKTYGATLFYFTPDHEGSYRIHATVDDSEASSADITIFTSGISTSVTPEPQQPSDNQNKHPVTPGFSWVGALAVLVIMVVLVRKKG